MFAPLIFALAQIATPAPAVDPLAAGSWGHGWFGGETVWTSSTERKTLAVGWTEGQVGFGRLGVAGTVGVLGKVGVLKNDDPATFEAFRGQLGVHYNVFGRGVAVCGPAVAAEYAVPLSKDQGQQFYHEASFGVGAECSGDTWRVYVLYGVDAQMPRSGVIGYGHFPVSDRISWVARTAFGQDHVYVITLDIVARIF